MDTEKLTKQEQQELDRLMAQLNQERSIALAKALRKIIQGKNNGRLHFN